MKVIRKNLKLITLILVIPFLFQSCTVYNTSNVSLKEAEKSELPVKITNISGEKEKFHKILFTDKKEFYGKNKIKIKGVQSDNFVLIKPETVKKIQIKDKTLSTITSIVSPLLIVGILIIIGMSSVGGVGGVPSN